MKPLLQLTLLLQLVFITSAHASGNLKVIDAWIPETPPTSQVMAGFMELKNTGKQDITITAASSPLFKTVEMHLSKDVDGVAKMIPQTSLLIPAGKSLILEPGSYHLMLIKPLQRLKKDDSVSLQLKLQSGETIDLSIPVIKQSSRNMSGMKCGGGKCGMGKCGGGK